MAEVRVSHPLHTHRFSANVRVAVTQKGHAEDKLAPINNKLMEKFHLKVQGTKSSFDSQGQRGCYSCTQGSCTGTSPESLGRRDVFSPKTISCKGAVVALMGEDCLFFSAPDQSEKWSKQCLEKNKEREGLFDHPPHSSPSLRLLSAQWFPELDVVFMYSLILNGFLFHEVAVSLL